MAMIDWPVRTQRLALRPYEPADLDALWAFERLPDVQRWLGWAPASREDLDDGMTVRAHEHGVTHVMAQHGAALVGHVMIKPHDSWAQVEIAEQAKGLEAELGWMFDPVHHGHGYATEAVRAVIELCFGPLGLRRVHAGCFADNTASWRLMERLGMRREEHSRLTALHRDGTWHDGMNYALLREEWQAL